MLNFRNTLKVLAAACFLLWIVDGCLLIQSESPRSALSPATGPAASPGPGPEFPPRYTGAIHVHSTYSDGGGTVADIVRAGQDAGLDFLFLTDHDTLQPRFDGHQGYHGGLLLLVGEEVNTSAGHLLALGVGRDVEQAGPLGLPALIEEISEAGGLSIAAHPTGRRPWTDWTVEKMDGLELLNANSDWRDDSVLELLRALVFLPFLPDGVFNSLIDRPDEAIRLWMHRAQRQPVTVIGSVDAHERIPLWGERHLSFPTYERMFGLIRTYVITGTELTGDAGADEAILVDALRRASCYVVMEGYEPAPGFSFELAMGPDRVSMGSSVGFKAGERLHVTAPSSGPVRIRLYRDEVPLIETEGHELFVEIPGPGVYHAEVYQLRGTLLRGERQRLWIISNAIRVE
ncbi:MAG: CehA/McbA family metallohydrolase [Gemmatimonadetes bacterium]|nr:CehA/McbA family metallohydrolase [Gemmatimonadota bacterium]